MKSRLKCEKPEQIEYTITMTATAEQWEQIRDDLEGARFHGPAGALRSQITNLLAQARKNYWPEEAS
jgi:hypothetical protein